MSKLLANNISALDKKEFSALVKLNMKRAYFSALGIMGSHDEAMEASQEAFIKAYNSYGKFDKTKKFFTWYYKILRNHCLNMLRDKKYFESGEILETIEADNEESAASRLEEGELKQALEKALFSLEASDREIIILKEFENYSYKEISELLEMPEGSVMSKLFYARKKLAKLMGGKI